MEVRSTPTIITAGDYMGDIVPIVESLLSWPIASLRLVTYRLLFCPILMTTWMLDPDQSISYTMIVKILDIVIAGLLMGGTYAS